MGSGDVLPEGRLQNLEESTATKLTNAIYDGFDSSIYSLSYPLLITSILKTTSLSKQTSFRGATVSLTVVSQWGGKVQVAPQSSVSCFHKRQYEKISKKLSYVNSVNSYMT